MEKKLTDITKRVLEKCGDICKRAIADAIKRKRLFNKAPWGAPLKASTINAKSGSRKLFNEAKRMAGGKKGSASFASKATGGKGEMPPEVALYDSGDFYRGIKFHVGPDKATIYSDGKNQRQQAGFILGGGNVKVARNPFKKRLPALGVGSGATIEKACIVTAAGMFAGQARAIIHDSTAGLKRAK